MIVETLEDSKVSDIVLEDHFNFQQSTMIRQTLQGVPFTKLYHGSCLNLLQQDLDHMT